MGEGMAIGLTHVASVTVEALTNAIDNVRKRCGLGAASAERINNHILDKLVKLVVDEVGRELLEEVGAELALHQARMNEVQKDFGYLLETDTDGDRTDG